LIRPSNYFASALALVALSLPVLPAAAQQELPTAPTAAAPGAPTASPTGLAPAPNGLAPAAMKYPMPKQDPANFTASVPTKEAVDAFLKTNIGHDESRIWEVWAIEKTPAEHVARVTVLVNDKSEAQKPIGILFYAMPDGAHFIVRSEKGLVLIPAAAPQDQPAAPSASDAASAPPASAPATPDTNPFPMPKPNPANFTAALPTKETVESYLKVRWGYDESRIWEVWAIEKTPVEGVSKVTVLMSDKNETQKPMETSFYTMADGKHLLTLDKYGLMILMPFSGNPFKEFREIVKQRAEGPYRGSASKDLEIVEFADFQCPHCKEAQANMDMLAADFPKARFVFQNFPLGNAKWKGSMPAAAYGVCVAKLGGSGAFFTYASAVFEGQEGLVSEDGVTLTLNAAVVKAGLEPAKIAECASTPATAAAIEASRALAADLNVNETPTLIINGREFPASVPYATIKQVILYQAKLDGVAAQ
jgi:protein-disulfide isomerase